MSRSGTAEGHVAVCTNSSILRIEQALANCSLLPVSCKPLPRLDERGKAKPNRPGVNFATVGTPSPPLFLEEENILDAIHDVSFQFKASRFDQVQ